MGDHNLRWNGDIYLWPYRIDDVNIVLPPIPPIKSGVETLMSVANRNYVNNYPRGKINRPWFDRNAVSSSLGISIKGACPVFPDFGDNVSFKAGFYYRVARGTPIPDKLALRSLTKFLRFDLKTLGVSQMSDEDVSYSYWRSDINFPETRKLEFDAAFEQVNNKQITKRKYLLVTGFCKEEEYKGEPKYPRIINARSDYFKVDCGPFFRQLEKMVFCLEQFIKKIPNKDRAKYIMEKVFQEGGIYICTDYTSYESGFRKEVMEAVEYEVYHYIGRGHPEFREFWEKIKVLKHVNRIQYKSFQADVPATRMSGEMNTSLGNGIFNLFAFRFACFISGSKTRGVVEGDDGLNWVDKEPNEQIFEKLGMLIKYEKHENIGDASFCGQVFDPVALQVVRDPIQTMIKMGWSTRQYLKSNQITKLALLRSRALSGLYENPGCPILNVWNLRILQLTDKKNVIERVRKLEELERDTYVRDKNKQRNDFMESKGYVDIFEEPAWQTRFLVERRYGISVAEQLYIENEIREMDQMGEVDLPFIDKYFTKSNKLMYEEYRNSVEPNFSTRSFNKSGRPNSAEDFFESQSDVAKRTRTKVMKCPTKDPALEFATSCCI